MTLRKPPLYDHHAAAGADFTDFGGWEMPISFDGIRVEHRAVRESIGIFDVSHMGEVYVSGPDSETVMNRLTTNDVSRLSPGDAQYSCVLRDDGIILDDTVVYLLPSGEEYLFVPNAGHDEQMAARWRDHAEEWGLDVAVDNRSAETAMVAVQGPDAVDRVASEADASVADLSRFSVARAEVGGVDCLVARTGYTGEDGFELVCRTDDAGVLAETFADVQPCGLGARDTLRLETGLLLSGQDFHPEDEPRTPFEANLGFTVAADTEFVGRDALADTADPDERMVGLEVTGRGIARRGYDLSRDGERVGHVTSGTMSPTLGTPIGLGYVSRKASELGTELRIDVRGRDVDATVVGQRFLDRRNP